MSEFIIGHISDLHFSEGKDQSNPYHSHSIKHLKGIEATLKAQDNLCLLIVSGDISNQGDKESLLTANNWIFKTIAIGHGEYTGLNMERDTVGIVPGNHDAWNAPRAGRVPMRRQKSLENYNYVFSDAVRNEGCHYQWLEKDGHGIYIAYVDSSLIGEHAVDNARVDKLVAKGNLSLEQLEQLLEWQDMGILGKLPRPKMPDTYIDKDRFVKSLKIIVMHHYLFSPRSKKIEYFHTIEDGNIVFRNFALADFDILLCGHRHVDDFYTHTYGAHFDSRAERRYLLNCFRRLIGIHSLPIQYEGEFGRKLSRGVSSFINWFLLMLKQEGKTVNSTTDELLNILCKELEEPEKFEERMKKTLPLYWVKGAELIHPSERREVQKKIRIAFTKEDKRRLQLIANNWVKLSKKLHARPFLQIMSGSSAKATSTSEKFRSFNIYKINASEEGWHLRAGSYLWHEEYNIFSQEALHRDQVFLHKAKI